MLTPLALILLTLFAFPILYNSATKERAAFACECIAPKPVDQALEESAAVFSGKVESVTTEEERYKKVIIVSVDRSWKGIPPDELAVQLVTGGDEGACGYSFEEGKSHLVYSHGKNVDGQLGISSCSRTQPIEQADNDLAILGTGYVPVISPLTAEQLEACKALEIEPSDCSEAKILSRQCLGGQCGSYSTTQVEVLQNPTMLMIFGVLAAGLGGAATVFYIKTRRRGKEQRGTW